MNKTAVVFSPKYYEHDTGKGHPESVKRLGAIINELKKGALSNSKKWQFIKPEKACVEDVELIHGTKYVKFVETFCRAGGGLLDSEDTVVSPDSFEVALYAAGGALKAADLVMKEKFRNAFVLVRPPGHHAQKFQASGFCIFNNVAIAAEHLLLRYRLKRILILDIDAHHGNGTQEAFYQTNKVLYIGLHQDPRGFPGTGFVDEIGESKGIGYNVNIPLPFRTNDHVYLKAINEIVMPIICQYRPQFMLISAGLDGHYTDPVASLSLSVLCYKKIYEKLMGLASKICDGKIVSILEGGYSLRFIGKLAAVVIAEMSGAKYVAEHKVQAISERKRKQCERAIEDAKRVQRTFWNID